MIVPRKGKYGVSVYDKALGRKRWVGTFSTRREAREVEREALRSSSARGSETCGDFARRWLTDYPREAAASRQTYRYALQRFQEDFARVRLRDLDKPTARAWALNQPRSNVRTVRAMFTDAINDGLHPGPNPFSNLRLEQPRGRQNLTALTEPEVVRLADCALDCLGSFGSTFRAMIVFAAYVGLRPGELYALERRDVGKDEVLIRQNLDGTGQIKAPKNGKARTVILPPPAREALVDVPARLDVPLAVRHTSWTSLLKGQPSSLLASCPHGVRSPDDALLRVASLLRYAPARTGRVARRCRRAARAHGRRRAGDVHVRSSLRASGTRSLEAGLRYECPTTLVGA
jgi:integrase